jgi:hypothetical protein
MLIGHLCILFGELFESSALPPPPTNSWSQAVLSPKELGLQCTHHAQLIQSFISRVYSIALYVCFYASSSLF